MMDKEFNEWVARSIPASRPMTQGDMVYLKAAWLESARRADRQAREECAEICARISKSYENTGYEWMTGVHSAKRCEQAIRETIK